MQAECRPLFFIPITPAQGISENKKLEFLKRAFLLLLMIRCLLKWWTPVGGGYAYQRLFGVFLVLLDTSSE